MRTAMTVCSWFVVLGAVALLQAHGMAFWRSQLGAYGIGWSVLLEVVALWLWSRPRFSSRCLGAVASGLLLLGPLYQVAVPVLERSSTVSAQHDAHQARVALLEADIDQQTVQLKAYTENARQRAGWLPALQATEARLSESRAKLADLVQATPKADGRQPAQVVFIIVMECIGLVLFQLTAVLAILQLASEAESAANGSPWFGLRPRRPVVPVLTESSVTSTRPKRARAKPTTAKAKATKRVPGVSLVAVHGGKEA